MMIVIKRIVLQDDDDNDGYEMQVIEEVITPAATPVFERDQHQQPAVKMPGVPR